MRLSNKLLLINYGIKMNFESKFTLDKEHYTECYEQSSSLRPQSLKKYSKALMILGFGIFFYMIQIEGLSAHLGAFFFILAFVELLSVVYARSWWVTRQMFSKASGGEVNLTLDTQGIHINSDYANQLLPWDEIESHTFTEKGVIVFPKMGGNSYISESTLSVDGWQYLTSQLNKIK